MAMECHNILQAMEHDAKHVLPIPIPGWEKVVNKPFARTPASVMFAMSGSDMVLPFAIVASVV